MNKSMQDIIKEANKARRQEIVPSKLIDRALARRPKLEAVKKAAETYVVMAYRKQKKVPNTRKRVIKIKQRVK
jgi:hypothetical protein